MQKLEYFHGNTLILLLKIDHLVALSIVDVVVDAGSVEICFHLFSRQVLNL